MLADLGRGQGGSEVVGGRLCARQEAGGDPRTRWRALRSWFNVLVNVGIGLAAAVLTPTADSAVHQAVEQLTTGSAGVVLEQELEQSPSLTDAIANSTTTLSDPTVTIEVVEVVSLSGQGLQVSVRSPFRNHLLNH